VNEGFRCKIRDFYSRLYRVKQKNAKFEFWRIFDQRLWPYPWMKFDEILTRYRVWSLLCACRKSKRLADFSMSNHLRLRKKYFSLSMFFFDWTQCQLMIKLKIRYHTDFHRFLSSTFGDIKEKPRKMARGFL